MARPHKRGLDYFPMDVHTDADERLGIMEGKFGLSGFGLFIKLLQHVYAQGYWCNWTEDEVCLIAKRVGTTPEYITEFVDFLAVRGIFSKQMLDDMNILTSRGIQERYFAACARRSDLFIVNEYLLIELPVAEERPALAEKGEPSPLPQAEPDMPDIVVVLSDSRKLVGYPAIKAWLLVKWNEMADEDRKAGRHLGLQKVVQFNAFRVRKLQARLKEKLFCDKLEEIVERIASSDFLRGKVKRSQEHEGWRATLDWLLDSDKFYPRILEGKYGCKAATRKTKASFSGVDYTKGVRLPDGNEHDEAVSIGHEVDGAGGKWPRG